jgi:hypothetical protein
VDDAVLTIFNVTDGAFSTSDNFVLLQITKHYLED